MSKVKFNIQDQFLNQVRKDGTVMKFEMNDNKIITGNIKGFDSFCIVVENETSTLLYKHAISSIYPAEEGKRVRLSINDPH